MSEETTDAGAVEATETHEAPQLSEVEQIASEKGWKPKDAYEGPEHLWRPADEFLRKMPASRDLKRDLKAVRDQVERMAAAGAKQTQRALEEQAREIEARFADAVENKDTAGAAKAARDMESLRSEAESAKKPSGDPEADFARDNPWYGKDQRATRYAVAISQELAAEGKSVEEQLAGVEREMRKDFPHLYGEAPAQTRKEPAAVAAPSRGGAKREKGYADLPPDAKKAADDYADLFKQRHGKDPEESKKAYARDYFANTREAA